VRTIALKFKKYDHIYNEIMSNIDLYSTLGLVDKEKVNKMAAVKSYD
jgi:hypothetical protein